MIPKVLHYVWLSGDEMDSISKRCIATWKKIMPDYTIRRWSMQDFPMETMPAWVKEAISVRKWALATDYLRLWILYNVGGIYMDADVIAKKPFDKFLRHRFFSGIEFMYSSAKNVKDLIDSNGYALTEEPLSGVGMQAAVLGSVKGHPFLRDCMAYYEARHYLLEDGSRNEHFIAPDIYAFVARNYGYRYQNTLQHLDLGMTLYEFHIFAVSPLDIFPETYAIHFCNNGWHDDKVDNKKFTRTVMRRVFLLLQYERMFYPKRGKRNIFSRMRQQYYQHLKHSIQKAYK